MFSFKCAIALIGIAVATEQTFAQAQATAIPDTVILRVTSPRGTEVAFSGSVVLRDIRTEQKLTTVRTPFEIRLPRQDIDGRFTADDGGALSGEIVVLKAGKQVGHVYGTRYSGTVSLYAVPGKRFGFGSRTDSQLMP